MHCALYIYIGLSVSVCAVYVRKSRDKCQYIKKRKESMCRIWMEVYVCEIKYAILVANEF